MKECTRKLRMLESETIGGFVQQALSRVRSAEATLEQGPADVFATVDRAIGKVGTIESDILRRIAALRREIKALE